MLGDGGELGNRAGWWDMLAGGRFLFMRDDWNATWAVPFHRVGEPLACGCATTDKRPFETVSSLATPLPVIERGAFF